MGNRTFSGNKGGGGGGGGAATTVTAGDASIVVGGGPTTPTVRVNLSNVVPPAVGTGAVGTSLRAARADHSHAGIPGGGVASVTGSTSGIVDNTDPLNPIVLPQFGSDTTVQLPNAGSILVDALRLLTTLPVGTVGHEYSKWALQLLEDGVQTDALTLEHGTFTDSFARMGVLQELFFLADTDSGIVRTSPNTIMVKVGGVKPLAVNTTGVVVAATYPIQFTSDGCKIDHDTITGDINVKPSTLVGNTNLGLVAGELATNATHGFPTIPTCNGVPTGVVTVPAGQAAAVLNIADGKIYTSTGGGVWVAA